MREWLAEFRPLALAINTEKARSEYVVAPLLGNLRTQLNHRVSLFSSIEFPAASEPGLAVYCDFILSRSPMQQFLTSPVAAIVEAKKDDISAGLGQCVASMLAARLFNETDGSPVPVVSGAVTTGTLWRFLQLRDADLAIDQREYHVNELPKLLGVLVRCWTLGDAG